MLFNSYIFIFAFLPVTLAGFFFIGNRGNVRGSILWLILASLFFYGWWNPPYLALIIFSVIVNFWLGVGINRARANVSSLQPKTILRLGVIFNLSLLGYFKYTNFFINSANATFDFHWQIEPILLPLAVSFFTFTQIAYLVDAYHGITEEYDFVYYAAFVTFFPHLIAGPIVSYRRLMPQFAQRAIYSFNAAHMADGLSLFSFGLGKKVLIADNLSPVSGFVFDQLAPHGGVPLLLAWFGAFSYAFQLYFDFSGYSDMAIGLARMFNIEFPLNFDSPYKARDIADFWRRWHITLSQFLRDHLYIPLGGNRKGEPRRYLNIMVTMLLGGLWHGAGWTFIIWGGLHGIYLVIHRQWQVLTGEGRWSKTLLVSSLGRIVTFLAVVVAWVFFRSHNLSQAMAVLSGMIGRNGIGVPFSLAGLVHELGWDRYVTSVAWSEISDLPFSIAILLLAAAIAFFAPNNQEIFRLAESINSLKEMAPRPRLWRASIPWALGTVCLFSIVVLHLNRLSEFLYFKF